MEVRLYQFENLKKTTKILVIYELLYSAPKPLITMPQLQLTKRVFKGSVVRGLEYCMTTKSLINLVYERAIKDSLRSSTVNVATLTNQHNESFRM